MNTISIIEGSRTIQVGREPVVLVPLKLWRKMEDYLEDREALDSKPYLRRIQKARKEMLSDNLVYPFRPR